MSLTYRVARSIGQDMWQNESTPVTGIDKATQALDAARHSNPAESFRIIAKSVDDGGTASEWFANTSQCQATQVRTATGTADRTLTCHISPGHPESHLDPSGEHWANMETQEPTKHSRYRHEPLPTCDHSCDSGWVSTRTRDAYSALWLVLAVFTAILCVDSGQATAAALTAWLGGIVTCRLAIGHPLRLRRGLRPSGS